jgi:hypothetical protein
MKESNYSQIDKQIKEKWRKKFQEGIEEHQSHMNSEVLFIIECI